MYLKKKREPDGDIYLSIMEKYYDSQKRSARERTVEGIGHVSELKKDYDDPVAYFTRYAKELTEQKKKEKAVTITIDSTEKMTVGTDDVKNAGYGILKELYRQLELDRFWNWKTRNLSIEFSVDKIFRLLVFSRILRPASKKGTFDQKDFYFEDFGDFSLDDVYHKQDQKGFFGYKDHFCRRQRTQHIR